MLLSTSVHFMGPALASVEYAIHHIADRALIRVVERDTEAEEEEESRARNPGE